MLYPLYYIKVNDDIKETIDILEQNIIHVSYSLSRGFGFVGNVNREFRSFWIIDRMNIYTNRKGGLRLYAYRRFEAFIYKRGGHTVIEGEFRLLPIYKISISIYYISLTLILLAVMLFSNNILETAKATLFICLMGLAGIGVLHFNLERSKKYEEETIDFIEGCFNLNKNI